MEPTGEVLLEALIVFTLRFMVQLFNYSCNKNIELTDFVAYCCLMRRGTFQWV